MSGLIGGLFIKEAKKVKFEQFDFLLQQFWWWGGGGRTPKIVLMFAPMDTIPWVGLANVWYCTSIQ